MDPTIERITGAAAHILPEIVLVATACAHFLAGPFLVPIHGAAPAGLRHRWGWLALIGLTAAVAIWLLGEPPVSDSPPLGPFHVDGLTTLIRGLSFVGGLVLLLLSWNQTDDAHAAEHHACLLLILAGVNLVAASNDLVMLFLALELVSIPTYLLLYLAKHDPAGQEATIKYFLISVFSSALVLFGFSYLFGVTGTTNLTALHAALIGGSAAPMPAVLRVTVVALVAGLAFRVTAVPFHFYAPDVFQGAAATGAALLAIVPKVAGLTALVRLLFTPAGIDQWIELPADPAWTLASEAAPLLWALAVTSILVGNVVALQQDDVRRLLAWSSVAHAGYLLIGLTVGAGAGEGGLEAMLFYLAAYAAMTVGAFAVLVAAGRRRQVATADDLAGLSRTDPAAALAMTVFLLSLIGLPPTAGFLGKLNLLLAAWSADAAGASGPGGRWLAVALAVGAAIGVWYYLRLIGMMYLGQPRHDPTERRGQSEAADVPALVGVACCAIATVGLFVTPDLLWPLIERLRWPFL